MTQDTNNRLELVLETYAIRSLNEKPSVINPKVRTLVRRLFGISINGQKKQRESLKYFRKAQRNVSITKKALEGYANNYKELKTDESRRYCDQSALEFINTLFCGSQQNVISLYRLYTSFK